MSDKRDLIGDVMPPGFDAWSCDVCTAACNFEAMHLCARLHNPRAECGFRRDRPASNGGAYGFMVPAPPPPDSHENRKPSPRGMAVAAGIAFGLLLVWALTV